MPECVGCGADFDSWTHGCDNCTNRHYKRAMRAMRAGGNKRELHLRRGRDHVFMGAAERGHMGGKRNIELYGPPSGQFEPRKGKAARG